MVDDILSMEVSATVHNTDEVLYQSRCSLVRAGKTSHEDQASEPRLERHHLGLHIEPSLRHDDRVVRLLEPPV